MLIISAVDRNLIAFQPTFIARTNKKVNLVFRAEFDYIIYDFKVKNYV